MHNHTLKNMFSLVAAVALAGSAAFALAGSAAFALPVIDDDDPMTAPPTDSKAPSQRPGKGPGDGGLLSGPPVPPDAAKGDGSFGDKEGGKGQGRERLMQGMQELRMFQMAMKSVEPSLTPDQLAKIESLRDGFQKEFAAWRDANADKMKAIEEKVRAARGGKPGKGSSPDGGAAGSDPKGGAPSPDARPDKATMEEMQKIKSTMPKFEAVRDQIMAVLTPDQQAELKENFAKARKEMEKRGGKGGPQKGKGPGGPDGQGPDGQKAPPPAIPPKGDFKFKD